MGQPSFWASLNTSMRSPSHFSTERPPASMSTNRVFSGGSVQSWLVLPMPDGPRMQPLIEPRFVERSACVVMVMPIRTSPCLT